MPFDQPLESGLASGEEVGQQAFVGRGATPVFSSVHLKPAVPTLCVPRMFDPAYYEARLGTPPVWCANLPDLWANLPLTLPMVKSMVH